MYSSSNLKWSYTCRGTNGGTNATCSVNATLNSAPPEPTCDLKPVAILPLTSCNIGNSNGMFKFHTYLSCINVVQEKTSCTDAGCTENAKRQELIYIAARIR